MNKILKENRRRKMDNSIMNYLLLKYLIDNECEKFNWGFETNSKSDSYLDRF